jgi:hypothetical protein
MSVLVLDLPNPAKEFIMSALREKYGLNETTVLKLKDGNDEPMLGADEQQCTVTVYGPGTKQHNKALARNTNVSVERLGRKGKSKITGDEFGEDNVEYAVLVTKSVSENLASEFPGMEGPDLFRAIYTDAQIGFLIRTQIHKEQQATENFTKRSTGA